jgi:hypothetical protein
MLRMGLEKGSEFLNVRRSFNDNFYATDNLRVTNIVI